MIKEKLTTKRYVSKYVFLKILFGEYKVGGFVPSEAVMAKQFNTTNLTIRSAYNVLIANDILLPIKGKGYQVNKDVISYVWPLFSKVSNWIFKIVVEKNYIEINFENNKIFLRTKWNIVLKDICELQASDIIKKILQNKLMNLDSFVNFKIKIDYHYLDNNIIIEQKFLDAKDQELLLIESSFNVEHINVFLSDLKFIKFL